jgi:F0F1-type ATP synthase assembly protein I
VCGLGQATHAGVFVGVIISWLGADACREPSHVGFIWIVMLGVCKASRWHCSLICRSSGLLHCVSVGTCSAL